jgi:hypothetical protein
VCLLGHDLEILVAEGSVLDAKEDGEGVTTPITLSDRHSALDFGLGGVLVLLLRDEVERAAEARGIACREEVFGGRGARLTRPTMAFGTDRSAFTEPSLASVCPLRPPVAIAVAVKSGLILSMAQPLLACFEERVS